MPRTPHPPPPPPPARHSSHRRPPVQNPTQRVSGCQGNCHHLGRAGWSALHGDPHGQRARGGAQGPARPNIGGFAADGPQARLGDGSWSAPSCIGLGGVGGGLEIGAEVTDFVIILNTKLAVKSFMKGSNVTFGGNLSAAAGPYGRSAEADIALRSAAAFFTYSHSRGLFGGMTLEGACFTERKGANAKVYGAGQGRVRVRCGTASPQPQPLSPPPPPRRSSCWPASSSPRQRQTCCTTQLLR